MPSTLIKLFVLLAFDILAIARPQSNAPADITYSGNYHIISCGTRAPAVKNLLDSTYVWLQTANQSLKAPAYNAFFGNLKPDYVANVIECTTSGVDVSGDPPTLVCVTEANPHTDSSIYNFWKECQAHPRVKAFTPHDSDDTMLCPSFFDLPLGPQPRDCGTVNRANTELIPSEWRNGWMLGTQYGVLIEALANFYIPKATTKAPLLFDIVEVNQCLGLRPDDAMVNPGSYAYFASSKLTLDVCVLPSTKRSANKVNHQDIRAGCTHFPTAREERELIEVNRDALSDSNGTKIVMFGCSGSEANSSTCS